MTLLSWIIELVSTISCFVIFFFISSDPVFISSEPGSKSPHERMDYKLFWIVAFDATLNYIVIPAIYILNQEENKLKIVANGWFKGLRVILGLQSKEKNK